MRTTKGKKVAARKGFSHMPPIREAVDGLIKSQNLKAKNFATKAYDLEYYNTDLELVMYVEVAADGDEIVAVCVRNEYLDNYRA
ncbi:MAG TPA: hypothetical protein VN794_18690 [Methylomirabilota bacterium]|nr:hypothetical protein [Methylomirabilota bacterium]